MSPATGRVPDGTRVYAVGDLHGCSDLLGRMHGLIVADARSAEVDRKVIVYVGDYVDRGPDSRAVIETLISNRLDGFETVTLRGNHDAWMLAFLDDVSVGISWLYNGGGATLLSYGIPFGGIGSSRLDTLQRQLLEAIPASHRGFLETLRIAHREGGYVFVHAGIRPGVSLDAQSPNDLLWIREDFLDSDADHGFVIVHGHTIADRPELLPNRIGIDTGAFATGRLTCVVLEGDTRRFIQT